MKASNIVLAVLAGAAIGGIIAIVLKAEDALTENDDDDDELKSSAFKRIAHQFSEKISSELKTAENKLKSAVTQHSGLLKPDEKDGVFL